MKIRLAILLAPLALLWLPFLSVMKPERWE